MLSAIDIIVTIPFNIWFFTTWSQSPLAPWPGWAIVHSDWSQISFFTNAELRGAPKLFYQVEITRWMSVIYGFVFFVFFGVAAEANRPLWQYISKIFHWRKGFPAESSRCVLGFVYLSPFLAGKLTSNQGDRFIPRLPTTFT
jgi:pheromone a factor receptor